MPSNETPIKITVARPELARCVREPFGVLGKLTQNEHSLRGDVARDTQKSRSGYQKLPRAHGILSGSWENSYDSNPPFFRMCQIPTNITVRIFRDQNFTPIDIPRERILVRVVVSKH